MRKQLLLITIFLLLSSFTSALTLTNTSILYSSFEGVINSAQNFTTQGTGTGAWTNRSDFALVGTWSAKLGENAAVGAGKNLTSTTVDTHTCKAVYVRVSSRDDDLDDADEVWTQIYNSSLVYKNIGTELGLQTEDTWVNQTIALTTFDAWHPAFAVKFWNAAAIANTENLWVDNVSITCQTELLNGSDYYHRYNGTVLTSEVNALTLTNQNATTLDNDGAWFFYNNSEQILVVTGTGLRGTIGKGYDYTVSADINTTAITGAHGIFTYSDGTDNRIAVTLESTRDIRFRVGNSTTAFCTKSSTLNGTIGNNTWYNVVVRYDSTGINSGICELWVNGINQSGSQSPGTTSYGGLRIGSMGAGYWWNGSIDNFQIYRGLLNSTGILFINSTSRNQPPPTTPAPVVVTISNLSTNDTIQINWTTNVSSNTSVRYGTTLALSSVSSINDATTVHNINLTGLINNTLYYYNVTSCNEGGCSSNGSYSILTKNNSCVVPTEDYVISSSGEVVFCPGTYPLVDAGYDGAIQIVANNVNMICNNTIFAGAGGKEGKGVSIGNYGGINITGCTFQNYNVSIYYPAGSSGFILRNSSLINDSYRNIWITSVDNQQYFDIYTSCEYDYNVLHSAGLYIRDSNYVNITRMIGGWGCEQSIHFNYRSSYMIVTDSYFNFSDAGIRCSNCDNLLIKNSTFNNMTSAVDDYFFGIRLEGPAAEAGSGLLPISHDINITNNTFINSPEVAVGINGWVENVSITNNYIKGGNNTKFASEVHPEGKTWGDKPCAIYITPMRNAFFQAALDFQDAYNGGTAFTVFNYSALGYSKNINISGNIIIDHYCGLMEEVAINLNHDLDTDYPVKWNFTAPTFLRNSTVYHLKTDYPTMTGHTFWGSATGDPLNRITNYTDNATHLVLINAQPDTAGTGQPFTFLVIAQGSRNDVKNYTDGSILDYDITNKSYIVPYRQGIILGDFDGCRTPTEDFNVNESITFCPGNYLVIDIDSNGVLLINSTNIVLTCNNTVIIGNRSGFGVKDYNFKRSNITIDGCTFTNYTQGIQWYKQNGSQIINSNFSGNGYNAYLYGDYNVASGLYNSVRIINSTFDNSYSQTSVYLDGHANFEFNNVTIRDNYGRGLYAVRSPYIIINNSRITNNSNGVSAGVNVWLSYQSDNSKIENTNMSIATSDDSCLNPITNNSIYKNNTLDSCGHFGINLCQNYLINNNTFINNSLTDSSIYLCAGTNNNITGNIINSPGDEEDTDLRGGITIENPNGYVVNTNYIYNNIINNSLTACLISGSYGNVWSQNILDNCNGSEVRVYNGGADLTVKNTDKFYGNIYFDGFARFVRNNVGAFNITIDENSTINHSFQIPIQTGTTYNLLMNYSGRKNLRIDNATIYLYNQSLQSPYDDVYNVSTSSVLSYDIDNYSINISTNQQIIVGDYGSANSCTYSGSGNWVITDNCEITTSNNLGKNNLIISGSIQVNITGSGRIYNFTQRTLTAGAVLMKRTGGRLG